MRNTEYFSGKKITVVGLARSGLACANLLYDIGAEVSVTESQENSLTRQACQKLKSQEIKCELGRHSEEFIRNKDLLVISPGVNNSSLPVVWAKKSGIPVISEIEVAWILCPAKVIAVTGTNGKTTVTTLIAKVLAAAGNNVFVCGNIGNPFTAEVSKMQERDFVSLEVSSFQLERIDKFKPRVAVILNFSRNHLDRHCSMEEYLAAKKRIFMRQDENDCLILNSQDPVVREFSQQARSKVVWFGEDTEVNPNFSAVLATASVLGIERKCCLEVFRKFKGVEHRLEFVAELNKVVFVNDSKSTTVDSTVWALKNITQPVVLIAGGRDKGADFSLIRELMRTKVKELILIGEATQKIEAALKDSLPIHKSTSLEEAVLQAFLNSKGGDCVLLSPMCASFDMFSDYEARGRAFKNAVAGLVKQKVTR